METPDVPALFSWLSELELLAKELYEKGATYFGSNKKLSELLGRLALDEAYHYATVLKMQDSVLNDHRGFVPAVDLEEAKLGRSRDLIRDSIARMEQSTLTENDICNCILAVEFSEWNDFFVFAVNSVFAKGNDAQQVASKCQRHITRLEYYFHSEQSLVALYDQLVKIPKLWNHRILVVDDDKAIRDLIVTVLGKKYYRVDTAQDGADALQKVTDSYYDVVVSDISMPEMDGIQLSKALSKLPDFDRETVILMSGNADPEDSLIRELGVRLIEKPFTMNALAAMIDQVLQK
ncbi:MAG TPA: response regulator [Spirochaetia bacterium]|nr:response regulator [Spirochaetia bacterium]